MFLPRPPPGPCAARAGFSLVELMGVVVLLGVLATVATVSWRALVPRTRLNAAVRELAAALHEARSDAISRSAEFEIEYYFEETADHPRGYRVVTPFAREGGSGLAARPEDRFARSFKLLPKDVFFRRITVQGTDHVQGSVSVRFSALGAASDHTIVLAQEPYANNLYTIEVQALTGLIEFHEGEFRRDPPKDSDFQ
jgi:prepilin-type N-terminal cleavage/methylation domain-containing protein